MSDEAAFLDALAANPADDTARLVYADWLDEHGEPAKAEYLRLVVALARAETDYARDQPDVARTLALAETLPADWRAAAGSRFKLIFCAYLNTARKVDLIRTIRSLTEFGLAEAARIIETAPQPIFTCVPFEQALLGREPVRECDTAVYVQPCDRGIIPVGIRYNLIGERWVRIGYTPPAAEDGELLATSLRPILGISTEQASRLIRGDRLVLAERLELSAARAQERRLDLALDACFSRQQNSYPQQGIRLHLTPVRVPLSIEE
ncbi:---NA--- : : Ribosomal_L12 [Gemmataceae bacterium]|nr:---NA--- : : Ribosomal_L12 [Gemmataceae bacterium]VTU01982.1 ---NA--- : : Ribosomal_L12 [Gemmataceae bacterium]